LTTEAIVCSTIWQELLNSSELKLFSNLCRNTPII